jgi:hypothetical protein
MATDLIWEDLDGKRNRSSYVRSAAQLAFRLSRLSFDGVEGLVKQALVESDNPDEAVEGVLEFTRNWAGFHFPRLLSALDRIQRVVLTDRGLTAGRFAYYGQAVESLFMPSAVSALEEYGIPFQVALQLGEAIDLNGTLDDVLAAIKSVDLETLELTSFEQDLVQDTIESL